MSSTKTEDCKSCTTHHVNGDCKIKTVNDTNNNRNGVDYEQSLFDSEIFTKIKPSELVFQYETLNLITTDDSKKEYAFDLGDNLILRPLKSGDFNREYLKLLGQLTVVGDDVTKEKFEWRFQQMKGCANTYYVLVVEDLSINKIVGSAMLVNEQKFIRHASSRGRVEDVVVVDTYRGKKLGKLLVDMLVRLSNVLGCYKVSLECKDPLKKFYQQFGFDLEDGQNYLCKRNIISQL